MYNPVGEEERLRAEADDLLWDRSLHSLLGDYGQVRIVGSYALRLMTWRDLDILLVTDDIGVSAFFEIGGRLATSLSPIRMSFRNERIARTPGLPLGLYWGVYLGEPMAAWKIDIWAVSSTHYAQQRESEETLAGRLDDQTRLAILEIKAEYCTRPGYRRDFTSRDIYHAVLDHGIRNSGQFQAYLDMGRRS